MYYMWHKHMYANVNFKKKSNFVWNLSGPCGTASWWQMDWLSASAVCRLGALYCSLLGKTEPFFLPVDSCLLERLRKTSVACKGEWEKKRERKREKERGGNKKNWLGLANTISPKCSISLPDCLLCIVYSRENMSIHHLQHIWAQPTLIQLTSAIVGFFSRRRGPHFCSSSYRSLTNSFGETFSNI